MRHAASTSARSLMILIGVISTTARLSTVNKIALPCPLHMTRCGSPRKASRGCLLLKAGGLCLELFLRKAPKVERAHRHGDPAISGSLGLSDECLSKLWSPFRSLVKYGT